MNLEKISNLLYCEDIASELAKLTFEEKLFLINSSLDNELVGAVLERIKSEKVKIFNKEESRTYLYSPRSFGLNYNIGLDYVVDLLDLTDEDCINYSIETDSEFLLKYVKDTKLLLNILDKVSKYLKSAIFNYIDDSDLAILINKKEYKKDSYSILHNFKSDEYIMRFLNKLPRENQPYVILKLSEENLKKYITPFMPQKALLISHISNDEEKYRYFNAYKYMIIPVEKIDIISSFKNIEYVRRCMKYINGDLARYLLIEGTLSKSPELFENNLDFYTQIISSIKSQYCLYKVSSVLLHRLKYLDLAKKCIDKIHNQKYIYELFENSYYQEIIEYLLPKMNQKSIHKYAMKHKENIKTYKVLLKIEDDDLLFEILEHYTIMNDYSDDMRPIFDKIAKKYGLSIEHLITLAKVASCSILSQITNPNIGAAINLDEENFDKYLKIFDKTSSELTSNSVHSILYSLLNNKFSIKFAGEVQIFIETLHAIDDGDIDKALENINKVISIVDLKQFEIEPQKLIDGILNKDEEIIKLYNKITYEYLVIKRNNYVNGEMELALNKVSSSLYNINELVKYMIKSLPEPLLYRIIASTSTFYKESEYAVIFENEELLKALIHFKKNPSSGMTPEIKQHLIIFNKLLLSVFSSEQYRRSDLLKIDGLKIEHIFKDIKGTQLLEIMTEVDVEKLKSIILNDPNLYNLLLEYLDKYDVLSWEGTFDQIAEEADVDMSPDVVASLISNFELIVEEQEKRKQQGKTSTMISDLSYAECLSSDAVIYQKLFGRENYRLLRRNPAPNRSPALKKVRLQKALEHLKAMHDRNYITVPPVNKDFKLKSGKSINIIVGNTNNPINLTYGERTGACMRIGGAGYSLFKFCLENENGFHIAFNDPTNGKLVSRVSCYRNGNTVFLNQVRYSLDSKYTNEDIQNAASLIAKELIELTKNSEFPIMNVVTSNDYAFECSQTTNLGCPKPTEGFPKKVYTDIDEQVVILATNGSSPSTIELGPDKCEKYLVGRSSIKKYINEFASQELMYIEALDAYLGGVSIDEIEVEPKEVKVAYVGEDWYVAITNEDEVISYVGKNSREPSKAIEEMNKYLQVIQDELKYTDENLRKKAR